MRWEITLRWSRTPTVLPPNSSLIRALTRSTVVRSLLRISSAKLLPSRWLPPFLRFQLLF